MGSDVAIAWQVAAAGDLPPVGSAALGAAPRRQIAVPDGKNERGARGRGRRLDAPKKARTWPSPVFVSVRRPNGAFAAAKWRRWRPPQSPYIVRGGSARGPSARGGAQRAAGDG